MGLKLTLDPKPPYVRYLALYKHLVQGSGLLQILRILHNLTILWYIHSHCTRSLGSCRILDLLVLHYPPYESNSKGMHDKRFWMRCEFGIWNVGLGPRSRRSLRFFTEAGEPKTQNPQSPPSLRSHASKWGPCNFLGNPDDPKPSSP